MSRYSTRQPYKSPSQRRRQAQSRQGWLMIAAAALGFAAMIAGAYYVDHARGITVDASLRSAGL